MKNTIKRALLPAAAAVIIALALTGCDPAVSSSGAAPTTATTATTAAADGSDVTLAQASILATFLNDRGNNDLLTCFYNSPGEVDPNAALYDLSSEGSAESFGDLSQAEQNDLHAAYGWNNDAAPLWKITPAGIDNYFMERIGIPLSSLKTKLDNNDFMYVEKYDAYYFYRSDSNYGPVAITGGRRDADGNFEVEYTKDYDSSGFTSSPGAFTVTLKPVTIGDIRFQFVSNVKN